MVAHTWYSNQACHSRRPRDVGRTPSRGRRFWLAAAALSLGALMGCGPPSVKDVCSELEERNCGIWSGVNECITDGNTLRERVEERGGCDGAFDDYLSCLGEQDNCSWGLCDAERQRVSTCVGGL